MHKRYYAQRMHIVSTLDALLYQLLVLSFFMSPSIWTLLLRLLVQQQCTRTRELDPSRSLRFYYILILLFNVYATWNHATEGAVQGRGIILDFVGTYVASKFQLVTLDISIILFQMLLTTIAFEIHVIENSDVQDTLLPPSPTPTLPISVTEADGLDVFNQQKTPPYIIDLTFAHILKRLRESTSPVTSAPARESVLPLPNTTPWSLPMTLIRARAQRREAEAAGAVNGTARTVPGSLDTRHVDG
ncbi:hypothetical protein BDZ89DRAFT_1111323 [Hymenopellis radicata]|nr:hypothetical protein BDZ89DRAFT_1111323 [Hymenopellis radicata]